MSKRKENIFRNAILIVVLVSMLPIMILGRYNHPTGDDYYYGAETHRALEETGSVAAALAEAARGTLYDYQTWQGTYSAMFLMRLSPTVFSEEAYHWVTTVILLLLTGGIFYLLKALLCDWLKVGRLPWMAVAAVLSVLAVQTVPTPAESMFWYNGSMYYTGYFAVTLFFWGLIVQFLCRTHEQGGTAAVPTLCRTVFPTVLLAVFLAGGNYISLLPSMIMLVLVTGILVWKRDRRRAWVLGSITAAMLCGFAVNAMAPGNAVRQSGMWQIAPWKAVAKSLIQGIRYMEAWMGIWWLIAALLLTPVFWNMYRRITFSFRYPVMVVGLMYGIFCSMSCPTFYTMNSTGPARVVAICYYGFLLFSFAAYWYVLGYCYRRLHDGACTRKRLLQRCCGKLESVFGRPRAAYALWGGMLLLLCLVQLGNGRMAGCTGSVALRSLLSGEAVLYQQEYEARVALLEDDTLEEVVLPPFVNRPPLLYVGDLNHDPLEPTNVKVALFYGKKSVSVSCAEE